MSPRPKKPPASTTSLAVAVSSLARLLDMPAGAEVTAVAIDGADVVLTLAGVDWERVHGWPPGNGHTPERITADYAVDSAGHRSLNFLALSPSTAATEPTSEPPTTQNPSNEKE